MVGMYFKIAMLSWVAFAILIWVVPFGIWFSSYMAHVASGKPYDEFDWEDNLYLKNLDEFLSSIDADSTEERAIATIVIWFLLGFVWFVGIFVAYNFTSSLHKNVKNQQYDKVTSKKREEV